MTNHLIAAGEAIGRVLDRYDTQIGLTIFAFILVLLPVAAVLCVVQSWWYLLMVPPLAFCETLALACFAILLNERSAS